MRLLRIFVLLLGVNLLLPTIAIHFVDLSSDDVVCELMEDFDEEEEDGKANKLMENSFILKDWSSSLFVYSARDLVSFESYPENNKQLRIIHLEVQTPPPKYTVG